MTYQEHCIGIMRQTGARITKPRLAVIRCLASTNRSLSPRAILMAIRSQKSLPDVNLVTIYRILETFADLGLVHRIGPSGRYVACSHIDCEQEHHILTHCLACGHCEERDLPTDMLAPVVRHLAQRCGFLAREHFWQLNGLCEHCARPNRRGRI